VTAASQTSNFGSERPASPPLSLALDFLTARELDSADFIRTAARHGFRSVSLPVQPALGMEHRFRDYELIGDTPSRRAVRGAIDDEGVGVDVAEVIALCDDSDVAALRPALESAAYLGAAGLVAVAVHRDPAGIAESFARLDEMAQEFGLKVLIEYMAISSVNSLGAAVGIIDAIGSTNISVMVDPLHLVRTGGTVEALRALDPRYIGRAQICDGPLASTMDPVEEAIDHRGIPGEGEFPLASFVEALPAGLTLGVEVPLRELIDRGVGPDERIRRALEGTRKVLAQAAAKPLGGMGA